ncbi:MAG: 50S ribosomal protein L10 [Flaviflexus sp.]|nr:50S ribosomal protein L10 [Flaviflexus sp.]
MARPKKSEHIAELVELFRESSGALLTEYRGLTVEQMQELRRAMGQDAEYKVAKNTLAKLAAKEAGVEGLDDELTGPTAIAFVKGEVATVAKALRDFSKEHEALVIKTGVLEGAVVPAESVAKLADLESREVLLAKAAGALKASLYKAAATFQAPVLKTVRTVDALREKQENAA